jgi:hypothetical protein
MKMRLMLGTTDGPKLLVSVDKDLSYNRFDFHVINCYWDGHFNDGTITVNATGDSFGGVKVLSDDQDRLRGDYNDVFNNFWNPAYIAPKEDFSIPEEWDDDIPF